MRQCKALAASRIRDIRRELYPGLHGGAWRVPGAHARRDCEVSLDWLEGSNAYLYIFALPSIASRMRPEAMVPCKTSRAI